MITGVGYPAHVPFLAVSLFVPLVVALAIPEIVGLDSYQGVNRVANPGCYATSISLGIAPVVGAIDVSDIAKSKIELFFLVLTFLMKNYFVELFISCLSRFTNWFITLILDLILFSLLLAD